MQKGAFYYDEKQIISNSTIIAITLRIAESRLEKKNNGQSSYELFENFNYHKISELIH